MYKKKKGIGSPDGLMPNASPSTSQTPSGNPNSADEDTETSVAAQGNGGNSSDEAQKVETAEAAKARIEAPVR